MRCPGSQLGRLEDADQNLSWRDWRACHPSDRLQACHVVDARGELPPSESAGLGNLASHFAQQCTVGDRNPSRFDQSIAEIVAQNEPGQLQCMLDSLRFERKQVQFALSKLKPSAAGADRIHTLLLRHLPTAGVEFLAELFTHSWNLGVLPTEWKQANMTPLLKDKTLDKTQPASYRPISLTSVACKMMERLILPRLWVSWANASRATRPASSVDNRHSTIRTASTPKSPAI